MKQPTSSHLVRVTAALLVGFTAVLIAQTQPGWKDCRVASIQKNYADGDWRITLRCEVQPGDPFVVGQKLDVAPPVTPCTPVNCTVGEWGAWADVGVCTNGQQQQQRTRSVTSPALCGGTCTDPLVETQSIACTPPVEPCTYGPWELTSEVESACVNNSKTITRTFTRAVLTGTGCTDTSKTEVTTQACGVVPPEFTLALSSTQITQGSAAPLTVTWANIPNPTTGDWLAIYDAAIEPHHFSISDPNWKYVDCRQLFTGEKAVPSGSCQFSVSHLAAGKYRLSLNTNESLMELKRVPFEVVGTAPACTYGAWTLVSEIPGACVNNVRTITSTYTRSVLTGTGCTDTSKTEITTQSCSVVVTESEPSNEVSEAANGTFLTVAWDPPLSGTPQGYRVYVGTASGTYDTGTDVGLALSYSFSTSPGVTYFVVVRAYSVAGAISPPIVMVKR
jgi:hypothetical protein